MTINNFNNYNPTDRIAFFNKILNNLKKVLNTFSTNKLRHRRIISNLFNNDEINIKFKEKYVKFLTTNKVEPITIIKKSREICDKVQELVNKLKINDNKLKKLLNEIYTLFGKHEGKIEMQKEKITKAKKAGMLIKNKSKEERKKFVIDLLTLYKSDFDNTNLQLKIQNLITSIQANNDVDTVFLDNLISTIHSIITTYTKILKKDAPYSDISVGGS